MGLHRQARSWRAKMSEKRYILLRPDEDGNPVTWVQEKELSDLALFKDEWMIERFLEDVPKNPDPSYWKDGDAMLLEVTIKKVVPVTVVEKYEIR
jgi:hypothetical protein